MIRGQETRRAARRSPGGAWRVTWLPGRDLTHVQATLTARSGCGARTRQTTEHGILVSVSNPLAWIAAIGGVAATIGAWRTEATARWQARAERLRTDRTRRQDELHRARLAEVWQWWQDEPDGDERVKAARWYSEWTGAAMPFRGGLDPGPQPPGFGCRDADEAYERYVGFLEAKYAPGHLAAPLPARTDEG